MSIRVLIADDHELIRSGLAAMLAGTGVEVVGTAATGRQTVQLAEKLKPDVILLDFRMPDSDAVVILEKLRHRAPQAKVIILSNFDNPTYMARAGALGAVDYLLKACSQDELVARIKAAATGQSGQRKSEFQRVAAALSSTDVFEDEELPLTHRERQVLRHVALGLSNKEISRSLDISVETVKEHVQNILRKLGLSDRTQAAVWAVRRGLV